MKQMHKQLPLNIISQFVNINKLEYDEMTKILKNTLTLWKELKGNFNFQKELIFLSAEQATPSR